MFCAQDHISICCPNQNLTEGTAANPAPAQLPPCMAPALQPEPSTAGNDLGTVGLAQTVQDVFSSSAFVTLASQLPICVMDNYAFEV